MEVAEVGRNWPLIESFAVVLVAGSQSRAPPLGTVQSLCELTKTYFQINMFALALHILVPKSTGQDKIFLCSESFLR